MYPKLRFLLDYIPLTVNISINEEFIQEEWQTIIKNSKEKNKFTINLIEVIGRIETTTIINKDVLKILFKVI